MQQSHFLRALCFCFLLPAVALGSPSPHSAAQNFIQEYIETNRGCGSGDALGLVLAGGGREAPFGKPAFEWTDEDLETLTNAMTECVGAASRSGNPYNLSAISRDAKRILMEVPPIVSAARQQRARRDGQIAARKRKAEERIRNAARLATEPTRETAEEEAARLEREAAKAEQEASMARQQKEFEKLKEDQQAARQRAQAERQQEAALRREHEKAAALEAERQHRAFLSSHNLTETSVLDLQSKGRDFESKAVAVTGYIKVFNEGNVTIYSGPNELSGIPLDLSTASADSRRRIFASCGNLYRDCKLEIAGVVGFSDHVFIWVQ